MLDKRRSGNLVVPGEKLGVIEEFIPDGGTYEKDGIIYSEKTGYVLMDLKNKNVSVYPMARNPNVPKTGSIVVGQVTGVQSSMVAVKIVQMGRKFISGSFTGLIHISDISFKYTENIFEAFKVGDIVRAKIINNKNGVYHISTKGENLGATQAFCSTCGGLLILKDNKLRCVKCEKVEKRKTASDYEKGNS